MPPDGFAQPQPTTAQHPTSGAVPLAPQVVHQRAADAPVIDLLGIHNAWRLREADTGGYYCVVEMRVPPGAGVPPHQHVYQEGFFTLEGTVEFARFEGDPADGGTISWFRVEPGDSVNVPSWAWHAWRNAGDVPARLLLTCAPGVEQFFDRAGLPIAPGTPLSTIPPSMDAIQRVVGLAIADGQRFAPLP